MGKDPGGGTAGHMHLRMRTNLHGWRRRGHDIRVSCPISFILEAMGGGGNEDLTEQCTRIKNSLCGSSQFRDQD